MSTYLLDYIVPITLIFSLLLAWKDSNARFLILSYCLVSLIGLFTVEWAKTMPIGFYLWNIAMAMLFLIIVFGRRYWAHRFSELSFFSHAYEEHRYTPQEAILVVITLLCIVNNLIAFIEVYLYSIYWLDNAYYKLHLRNSIQNGLLILSCIVCYTFVMKKNNLTHSIN